MLVYTPHAPADKDTLLSLWPRPSWTVVTASPLRVALATMVLCALSATSLLPVQKSEGTVQLEFGVKVALKGAWNEAAFRFEKATRAEPDNARAFNNLGVARENIGDFEGARKAYERALELEPDDKRIQANHDRLMGFLKQSRKVASAP